MGTPTNNLGFLHTFLAAAAIEANTLVRVSAADTVTPTTAINDDAIGVATETVQAGERVVVFCGNGAKHKIVAGAAVAAGAQVMPQAAGAGRVVTAAGATAKSVGIALSSTAAAGEVLEVLLRFGVNGPANA